MIKRFLLILIIVVLFGALGFYSSGDTHYVSQDGSNNYPYTNWVTAAHDIQNAVNAASDGDMVLVTNGFYSSGSRVMELMENRVAISRAITVQSVNGPEVTAIVGEGPQGNYAVRGVYMTTNSVLSGFTVQGGYTRKNNNQDLATDSAGGILARNGLITNCIISGNFANEYGGGITLFGDATIRNSTIRGNWVNKGGGGGIYMHYGGWIYDCTIISNTAYDGSASSGGGIYNNNGNNIERSLIIGNHADGAFAGGMVIEGGGPLINCVLAENTAYYSGGLYSFLSTIQNCTIVSNSAMGDGSTGGLHVYSTNHVQNTIIYYNTGPTNGPDDVLSESNSIDFVSCNYPQTEPPCINLITNPPQLVDITLRDYHLLATSPCIDAGSTNNMPTIDIDGVPRPLDGDADDTNQCDIGATEYTSPLVDSDLDTLNDYDEVHVYHTHPLDDDTDDDNFTDGDEVSYDTDPLSPTNYPSGIVSCDLTPESAITYGAQWRLDHGPFTNWQDSSYLLEKVPMGFYTQEYKYATGFLTPTAQTFTVTHLSTNITSAEYIIDMAYALNATDITWQTTGAAPWFGQTNFTHDGKFALQSGHIEDGEVSILETTLTGPGLISFWWLVDSEEGFDKLAYINGDVTNAFISGKNIEWDKQSFVLTNGLNHLKWAYVKDSSGHIDEDAGWIDEISYIPWGYVHCTIDPPSVRTQAAWRIVEGMDTNWLDSGIMMTNAVAGSPTLSFKPVDGWIEPTNETISVTIGETNEITRTYIFKEGTIHGTIEPDAAGVAGAQWRLTGGPETNWQTSGVQIEHVPAGVYTQVYYTPQGWTPPPDCLVEVVHGETTNVTATFSMIFSYAINTTGYQWQTTGHANWFGQTNVTHDGHAAMQSGAITNDEHSTLRTFVLGPGDVSFWWKTDSEAGYDYLSFLINDETNDFISGKNQDWQYKTVSLTNGLFTLEWIYAKDTSGSIGTDAGWIDEFFYTGTYGVPGDSDGDGMEDWQELLAGTDPFDDTSCFEVETTTPPELAPTSGVVVTWFSVSNRLYHLQRATNLIIGFDTDVAGNIPATPPMNVHTDETAVGSAIYIYRVMVETE